MQAKLTKLSCLSANKEQRRFGFLPHLKCTLDLRILE